MYMSIHGSEIPQNDHFLALFQILGFRHFRDFDFVTFAHFGGPENDTKKRWFLSHFWPPFWHHFWSLFTFKVPEIRVGFKCQNLRRFRDHFLCHFCHFFVTFLSLFVIFGPFFDIETDDFLSLFNRRNEREILSFYLPFFEHLFWVCLTPQIFRREVPFFCHFWTLFWHRKRHRKRHKKEVFFDPLFDIWNRHEFLGLWTAKRQKKRCKKEVIFDLQNDTKKEVIFDLENDTKYCCKFDPPWCRFSY